MVYLVKDALENIKVNGNKKRLSTILKLFLSAIHVEFL